MIKYIYFSRSFNVFFAISDNPSFPQKIYRIYGSTVSSRNNPIFLRIVLFIAIDFWTIQWKQKKTNKQK